MTADLLHALAEIEERARQTQLQLAAGLAVNGNTGLRRIELLAADARRHATQVCDESETKETVG